MTTDVQITIAAAARESIWAVQTQIAKDANNRTSGRASKEATQHTLLAIALLSGLQNITGKRLSRIKLRNGNQKPSVKILTSETGFAEGISAFISGARLDGFKAGKNFWHDLRKTLNRFAVTVEVTTEDDPRPGILATWGVNSVLTRAESLAVPAVFRPSVVSTTR
jgi:hypothetical protein